MQQKWGKFAPGSINITANDSKDEKSLLSDILGIGIKGMLFLVEW